MDVGAEEPRKADNGLLVREMNSGELVVTVEMNEVKNELKVSRETSAKR